MIPLNLSEIAQATNGKLVGEDTVIHQLSTDSRALNKDDVFLALVGANFDGHKFAKQAEKLGCSALIVEKEQDVSIAQVIVADTRLALGQIGALVKKRVAPKTVGITGSSGKTTVKEMVAAILARLGKVLATDGNFNNDIGVPLTLLRLEADDEFAVIEMGANHIGEIAYTCGLVKPDVSIINNIAAAHLEGFGDLCGVARAKGEIFEGLKPGGIALYNQDSKYANKWQWRLKDKTVRTFSCEGKADCFSENVSLDVVGCASFTLSSPLGKSDIKLTIPGRHNVCNAVAAAAIALEMGASLEDIRLGLAGMAPVKGRLNLYQVSDNFKVIDDSYNANVESMKAAADLLASFAGKRILVVGDMGELGAEAGSYHQEIGNHARSLGIDYLVTLGVLSQATTDAFGENAWHFNDKSKLVAHLQSLLDYEKEEISMLVKGSRSSKMELVVQDVLAWQKSLADHENEEHA